MLVGEGDGLNYHPIQEGGGGLMILVKASCISNREGGGGLVILLVASCNNNQDKLRPDEPLSSIADLNLYSGIRSFLGTAKCFFDPSHPYINMYILHTAPYFFYCIDKENLFENHELL